TTRSVDVPPTRYGSDNKVLSPKDAYLNSELIVVGAAYTADRKLKQSYTEIKKLDKAKAREEILIYAEEEVERLFATNVTHSNKEDVLQRAKRAARFLIDEYFDMEDKIDEYCISPTRYGSDSEKSLSNNLENSDNDKTINIDLLKLKRLKDDSKS
ncbi:20777_t:CDS:2, partial [Cetraspora pellucida]